MICPQCNGEKMIHISAEPGIHQRYDVVCPICEGTGVLVDLIEFPNSCPACGEPIRADEEWCEFHKESSYFGGQQ